MSECGGFQGLIEGYLVGDISSTDLESLRQHARSCPECGRVMELHEKLSSVVQGMPEPSEIQLRATRAAVLRQILGDRRRKAGQPIWRRWAIAPAARPAVAIAFALVLVTAGFLLGRLGSPPQSFDEDVLVQEIVRQASLERGIAGYWDSPFVYSNVAFHPQNDGSVSISFDVTRHVDLETTADSPLAKEILLHAILDPSTMGSRLKAIALAPKSMDARLEEVLAFTLLNDPNYAVRLRALETLKQYAADPGVQDALLLSLRQDPSVQIRLMALECLVGQHVDPATIRRAIGQARQESNSAVLQRAFELTGWQ